MANLNFISQFEGDLGIPIHAREFANALEKKIKLNKIQINKAFRSIGGTGLIFWYPQIYKEYNVFDKTIGYFIFEYKKIPKNFVEQINSLDGICTASKWAKKVLMDNGVLVPIYVVHGGINPDKFNDSRIRVWKKGEPFKFLHIGKAEERKGTKLLIRAFNQAFQGKKDVRLTLSIDNPHIPNFSAKEFLAGLTDDLSYPVVNIDIVGHIDDIKTLYKTHDASVFPTLAEGIGLPIIESMACGLTTIVSNNTGITEYADKKTCVLLEDFEKVPVYDEHFFPRKGEYGEWDKPKLFNIIEKLRWVYDNKEEARKIGRNAADWMKKNYTWDHAADQFIREVLNEN